jgi:hypothetical protein
MFELQHWDYVDEFSADEMAGLMIGVDPRSLGKLNSWRTIEPVLTRIERDYKSACEAVKMIFLMYRQAEIEEKLKTTGLGLFSIGLQNALDNYSWLQESKHVLDWIASNEVNFSNQKFDRASIEKWLVEFKLSSRYNFGQQEVDESSTAPSNNLSKWPWGSHTTRDLEDLRAAAIHWWSSYSSGDPASAPKNENVIRWLMEERGTVEAKAKNIASILRPRDLKSGPRVQHADKK